MMTDSVRLRTTRLRDRPLIYFLCVIVGIAAVSTAILVGLVHHEASTRTRQLQDVICGVYVPISNAKLTGANSALGRTIVLATRHGALELHCPGAK